MHEHHHLMAELNQLGNLLEGYPIHVPPRLRGAWLSPHADEMLFQRDWTERRVEKEKTSVT